MINPFHCHQQTMTAPAIDRKNNWRETNKIKTYYCNPKARFVAIANRNIIITGESNVLANNLSSDNPNSTGCAAITLKAAELFKLQPDLEFLCFLGVVDEEPIFACPVAAFVNGLPNKGRGFFALPLKDFYNLASPTGIFNENQQLSLLAQAYSLIHWHKNNLFCCRCGTKTFIAAFGAKRICPNCQYEHFPRVDPAVIMLVYYQDRCLLARGRSFEQKRYSCLAGFVEQGETLEAAVIRETFEEMAVRIGRISYCTSQAWPFPNSLMLGCFAEALTEEITIDYGEMADGRWFSRSELHAIMQGTALSGISLPPPATIAHYLIANWLKQD